MSEQRDLLAGRYRLQHRIGSGGMGHVWLAWDERLGRAVAVKQLRAIADLPEREADIAHQRAMREARITARLEHANAVPVFDVVDHEGQPCLVMQYVPSRSLHEILQTEGTLPPVRVARVGAEIASALADAHAASIVHRDVKPGNILITDEGTALITDFGISRAVGDASLTSTGMLTGTPAYLAPEVARGASSTTASDVFSLGATLYAAVEGTPPFGAGENPMALLHKVASGIIDPPRLAGALSSVLLTMLDADPTRRPTMQEAAESLARLAPARGALPPESGAESQATRLLPIAGSAAVASVGAAALGSQGGHTVQLPSDPPAPVHGAAPAASPAEPAAGPTGRGAAAATPAAAGQKSRAARERARAAADDESRRRRRRAAVLALALAIVLLGVWWVWRPGDPAGQAAPAPQISGNSSTASSPTSKPSATSAAPTTSATSAAPTTTRATQSTPTRTPTRTTAPTTQATEPPAVRTTAPTPPAVAAGTVTASALSKAIRDYYGLLPGDTDAGWALLTDRYRRTTATSRAVYERFWGDIRRVKVSDISSEAPSSVVATLRYDYADGRTFLERTAFDLVRQDGRLKIDRSSVLSSRQV